ncbi:glutathionylspermidine synthase family protein [Pedosphaera parvula]|uniref:Glutathionylspermidine synthase n=1 Tax=Pedosphaera parvula (strain Ellin514) TaxID=320771 RepID=B9XE63_PEDPL|nr:glutathionylspermidine synthase family protein [Pedosphaera parvula]EEF61954.1 glutathionylspermidine synthase [Pedosphaera parvula Ellin514]
MKRNVIAPRPDWEAKVEEVGLTYHTPEGQKYWDESAYYELTSAEVDTLEKAANDLHVMCIAAAQHVIDEGLFGLLGIPEEAVPYIKNSWERDDFSIYGRFDQAYDGKNPPKMLEYNADTPTALVEAAVAQWYWLQDFAPNCDQFNSIHEKLVAAWGQFKIKAPGKIYFGGIKNHLEDAQTVLYLQDTCHQAGLEVDQIFIEDLGYDKRKLEFVDLQNRKVSNYFKLYPWEWMWHEEFSYCLKQELCNFIEPMWKMLLSNKGLLPILWKLYPGHPNLLPAYFTEKELLTGHAPAVAEGYVRKPKLSREGANVSIIKGKSTVQETQGEYGEEGYVYQALAPLADFDGNHPIMGTWVVNHEACGLGIREDTSLITGNCSRFVPHLF